MSSPILKPSFGAVLLDRGSGSNADEDTDLPSVAKIPGLADVVVVVVVVVEMRVVLLLVLLLFAFST